MAPPTPPPHHPGRRPGWSAPPATDCEPGRWGPAQPRLLGTPRAITCPICSKRPRDSPAGPTEQYHTYSIINQKGNHLSRHQIFYQTAAQSRHSSQNNNVITSYILSIRLPEKRSEKIVDRPVTTETFTRKRTISSRRT